MKILDGCILCGACLDACPTEAIYAGEDRVYIDQDKCLECNSCWAACPLQIILTEEDE